MTSQNLEIAEYNEAGSLVATYITAASRSQNVGVEKLTERVDVVVRVNLFSTKQTGSFPAIDLI
jgi:hypothetical protein